jgi:hypothetical protein
MFSPKDKLMLIIVASLTASLTMMMSGLSPAFLSSPFVIQKCKLNFKGQTLLYSVPCGRKNLTQDV